MSAPQPPAEVVSYWCPVCGRQSFSGRTPSRQPHLDGATHCAGKFRRLVYTLAAPTPKEV